MKEKFQKVISIIKKDGIWCAIKKIIKFIKADYISKINIFQYIYIIFHDRKIQKEFDEILDSKYDRIIIWRSSFGWNVPLFQRPQHISNNLAEQGCLIFYEVTTMTDKVKILKKIKNNLFLINLNNNMIKNMLIKKIKKINKPKYIQFYSTDATISVKLMKEYIDSGFRIIYEYIDDLNPSLVGTKELPVNIKEKYEYILKDTQNIFVVVTADEIEKDVIGKRGKEKLVFACNGVDYTHFQQANVNFQFDKTFNEILQEKKPIIGYYGALASWFDYDMLKYLAQKRPDYNIVLLGIKYDNSFDMADLKSDKNVYFLGPKSYDILPNYAKCFNVCTIPFLINSITQATSPVKLFEYMAMGKPIVTTDMHECRKYKSVMIAKAKEEFVELIDKSILLNRENNADYFELLNKEALENTWQNKSKEIIKLLEKHENKVKEE